MKRILLIILTAIAVCCCSLRSTLGTSINLIGGCSEVGIDFSEERATGAFSEISTSGPFNLYYYQSDTRKVLVEGKEEFVGKVITSVKDEELDIRLENGTYTNLVLRVSVWGPDVDEFSTTGSGNIIIDSLNTTGGVHLHTLGSGDIKADNIVCKDFSGKTAGSGNIKIARLKAGNDAELTTLGSGDCMVNFAEVDDVLTLKTSGSGDIIINGSCHEVIASTLGSGDIRGRLIYDLITQRILGSGNISF